MSDTGINSDTPSTIRHAWVKKLVSRALSPDGATAQIVFETTVKSDPETIVLEISTHGLAPLQSLISDLRREAERKNLKTGMVVRAQPKSFVVGHSDDQRGFVALMFDEKEQTEQILMVRDEDAVKLAKAIIANVASRGGPVHHGIILPNGKILGAN